MISKQYSLIFQELGYEKLILFSLLNIIVLLLELLSFSMFIPFLLALTSIDKLLVNDLFLNVLNIFQIEQSDTKSIILLLFAILIIVFFLKNLFIGLSNFFKYKIISNMESELTSTVFQKYLRKPYVFHTSENSSIAIRNIIGETAMFVRSYLGSILNIIIETMVLIGIFVILFINEPLITSKLIIYFSVLAIIFFFMFNKKYISIGRERQKQDSTRIKYVQQGIQGIKEIIAFNLQDFILSYFKKSNSKVIKSVQFAGFINTIPKLIMETCAIGAILVIFLTTKEIQNDVNKHIFVLGLISLAAFRLFPAINKILMSINTLQYSKPSVKVLTQIFEDDFKNINTHEINKNLNVKEQFNFSNCIEVRNLKFKYPYAENYIFTNLNLTIKMGENIGIMGSTGSGKSTFVDLILGILNPVEGEICCDSKNINSQLYSWRNLIGYVSQFPYLLDDTIEANIAIGEDKNKISKERVINSLEIANMKNFVLNQPNSYQTLVGEKGAQLSGGQIQRLAIARALYKKPKILLLDEATASVDAETQTKILDDLNKNKKDFTSISISHNKDALIHCDKIYQLVNNNLELVYSK
jgi:ABC-type multidrug transport system fused ATPase/permease subunit